MMTARLTDTDRRAIARARELAALGGPGVRECYGPDDPLVAYSRALGAAQVWLAELAAIAERLDGE
jgi:hypothetical protein